MSKKPNVVIIMTDQQRADMRKSEGFALDTMPFLDSIAQSSADMTKAYTSMPVCGPARVSLFTGRYPSCVHVKTNHNIADAFYTSDLVDVLKENGYSTALCGKNHSHLKAQDMDYWYELSHDGGHQADRTEIEKEFDEWLHNLKHMTSDVPTPFPVECQGPYRSVSKAIDWIDSVTDKSSHNDADSPFFLWLSFAEPHNPYQVPEPYFSMFQPESLPPTHSNKEALQEKGYKYNWVRKMWENVIPDFDKNIQRTRANYCGMLKLVDDQLKRFSKFLDEKHLSENTIFIYLADHGDFAGEYGLIRKGPELPEVLCRIPMLIQGPGIVKTGKVEDIHVSLVDIMPTICDAIDTDIPTGVQGKSLWPFLTGQSNEIEDFQSVYMEHGFGGAYYDDNDTLDLKEEGALNPGCTFDCLNSWTQAGTMRAVRKGNWKLLFDMEGNGQLYNLEEDPVELNNLFNNNNYKNIRHEMTEELLKLTLISQDPLPYPQSRYVYKQVKNK